MAEAAPRNPTGAEPSPTPFWEPPDPGDLGRVLPGYSVLSLIGSGGMGAVYRAKQVSLGRVVALKVISPDHAHRAPEFTSRFNREAAALAKLSHPNIAHLFDCGRTQDGQLFIATEFMAGRDVGELMAGKQPLEPRQVLSIASAVCVALEHAHERGVLHGDLKPANVMVDGTGRVKVTDFALARILQSSVPAVRQTTSLLGTPRFTAPEALAPGAAVDARADVFSVGVLLYQMLTGEVPRGAAPPPSEFAPEIDPRFDAIVASAMAEDPDERYPDAASLFGALEDLRNTLDQKSALVATPRATPSSAVPRSLSPDPFDEPYYEADSRTWEEPASSMMPWLSSLAVVGIAAFWGWQQWKHPAEKAHSSAAPSASPTPLPAPAPSPPTVPVSPPATKEPALQAVAPPVVAPSLAEAPPPPSKPAPAPALPPAPTVAPMAQPAAATEELAETQRRVAQIQADFDAGIKEWQAGQDAKFNQLDGHYLNAVRNAIVAMRNARRLADQSALQEEERCLVSRTPLPVLDLSAPPERARLRATYDNEVRKIAIAGAETKVEIYDRLLGSLFAYQSILKQTNKAASADVVAALMDRSVAERDEVRATLKLAPASPQ